MEQIIHTIETILNGPLTTTELCEIMKSCGSDKGLGWHNYTTVYYHILKHLTQSEDVNVFELGIGTNNPDLPSSMGADGIPGASLRGWSSWLPNARIVGADIDKNILFAEERITTHYVDQRDTQSIECMWDHDELKSTLFDLIVDDGLHEFAANDTFIHNSHNKLKKNGIYIIEDICYQDSNKFQSAIDTYLQWFSYAKLLMIPNAYNGHDNNVLVLIK